MKGNWKLAGFNFSLFANYKPGPNTSGMDMVYKEYNVKEGFQTLPDLDYAGIVL